MNSFKLTKRICNCLSDDYDGKELRNKVENSLYNELSQISNNSSIKAVLLRLCERVEDLESN